MVLNGRNSNAVSRFYTWGLDLSGTLHGAGGIGGLLAAFETNETASVGNDDGIYWFFHDANGNVGQIIDANVMTFPLVAQYQYDAYGRTLAASGTYAAANPFRFSTKWLDGETGLYYYGYRYYSPRLGRWMSRDPMGEVGGVNMLGFCSNGSVNKVDPDGREEQASQSVGQGCPRVFPPNATKDPKTYNCAGLAFQTYTFMGDVEEVKNTLRTRGRALNRCTDKCRPCEKKCYLWEYDIIVRYGRTQVLPPEFVGPPDTICDGAVLMQPHRDFHIVCGQTDTNGDNPQCCSKNGPRPIETYNGRIEYRSCADWEPLPKEVLGFRQDRPVCKTRVNMAETCYCME
jgi:RHS repeat-associated protein